ncbi:hypothetical protein PHLGIDRAFT_117378 [Phlebiopsis gigantea 11061_1 CR5-6]|uniref:CST complex subunit Stn1 N-terminal domain-containing protein n=1 Tax=Phlebiopsis gigantea (strain 11061_1 CR5-6) TaxID=745531 RepID=A0A0C3S9H3_PHLG1|nr:hypothetical protein PHLGIDRAFT_117378 [Phlebiopsis gigantea 11061_1 CR5-6]
MSSGHLNDPARVVRIDALTQDHISQKLRVTGRIRLYDVKNALVCIADEQDTLIVDISLCLSGYHSYPWLHEENAVVMAIGYLERFNEISTDDDDTPVFVLRALLIKEQRGLDLAVWNKAIELSPTHRHPS